jgi:hypothetical protein
MNTINQRSLLMKIRSIRRTLTAMTLVAAIGAGPQVVWAQDGASGNDPSRLIQRFDQDGDGLVSEREFPGPPEHFVDLDTDGDGFLTSEELLAGRPGPPEGGGFENDDADQDGRVSQAEFSGPAELFSHLDTDGDGYITRDEARPGKHPHGGPGRPPETDQE